MAQKQNQSRQPQLGTYVTMIIGLLFLFLLISQAGKYHSTGYIMEKAKERLAMREDREKTLMLIGAEPQKSTPQVAQRRGTVRRNIANANANVNHARHRGVNTRQNGSLNPLNQFAQQTDQQSDNSHILRKRDYRVRSNDTLYNIAAKVYGNGNRWRDIVDANPSISDPSLLRPGMRLVIPVPQNPAAAAAFSRWSRNNTM